MKKNKFLLAIFILFIVGVAVYKFNFSKPIPKTIVVSITDKGFSPSRLAISKGDTVTWINKSERLHWPASNDHPTHSVYPEEGGCLGSKFDACKGLSINEIYSFTFDKLGVWPVHDHLFPGLIMTIEVLEDAKNYSGKYVYNKNTKISDFQKFNHGDQVVFIQTLSESNPAKAWSYLKEAFILDGQVIGNGHDMAHVIGNQAYKKLGLSGMRICDDTFAFGCFHGVTEEMLLTEGPEKIEDIERGCLEAFPPGHTSDYTGCIHGTGHGIYTWESGDINKSLGHCDIFTEDYRQYCYDGVFMENSSNPTKNVVNPENPWKLCSDLPERYHYNCARYQSHIFLKIQKSDPEKNVGILCASAPFSVFEETCFQSLGFYISQSSLGNMEKIINKCELMPSVKGREICIRGSAIESVFQRYPGHESSSLKLCEKIESPLKIKCLENVNRMLEENKL